MFVVYVWHKNTRHRGFLPISTAKPSLASPAVMLFHSAGKWEWGPPEGANKHKYNVKKYFIGLYSVNRTDATQSVHRPWMKTTSGILVSWRGWVGLTRTAPKSKPAVERVTKSKKNRTWHQKKSYTEGVTESLQYCVLSSSGGGVTSKIFQWKSKVKMGCCRVRQVTFSPAEGRKPNLCIYIDKHKHMWTTKQGEHM